LIQSSDEIVDVLKDSIEDRTKLPDFATELFGIFNNPFKTIPYSGHKGSNQQQQQQQSKVTPSEVQARGVGSQSPAEAGRPVSKDVPTATSANRSPGRMIV